MGAFQDKLHSDYNKVLNIADKTFVIHDDFIFGLKANENVNEVQKIELVNNIQALYRMIREFLDKKQNLIPQCDYQQLLQFHGNLRILKQKIFVFNLNSTRVEKVDFAQMLAQSNEIAKLCEYIEGKFKSKKEPVEIVKPNTSKT